MNAKLQNNALPLVKEVRETKDANEASNLILNGGWICIGITPQPNSSEILFSLGRVD